MKRIFLIVFVVASLAALGVTACSGGYTGEKETVTFAAVPTELNALLYVAMDQGFLEDNGLEIILKEYDSGAAAAAGMTNAEADVALAAEFPIVGQVFDNQDIMNLGTITRYENTYIIWRAGSGIGSIRDLKGKKIGVTMTTISEFYLGRTLELNGMNIDQIALADVKAADSEDALVNGDVDAVVTWEPWVDQIRQSMGYEVVIEAAQSAQYAYWNLVSSSAWINDHPGTAGRLVESLVRAERYIGSHPDEAKAIVSKRMNFKDAYIETIWPRYQFSLSLDQSLVTAMEDEARWIIGNSLTAEKVVPDFNEYIYTDALKAVKPEAVNIIR